jgi:predicted dehydrogenase
MGETKVRIGFVGTGAMGQCAHLRNFATLPQCEVVAIAELRPELRQQVAARYGIPRTYADHREMLAAEKLDGIVSAQPFTRHGVLLPELMRSGIPLLTEKPLASSVATGEALLRALKEGGTWHKLGYHKRSDPATQYAKAAIDQFKVSGELGAMRYVRLLMPAGDWIAGGFFDLIKDAGNAPAGETDPSPADMDAATAEAHLQFVNYYIHQVNLMRHLLGESYSVTFADPSGVLMAGCSASGIACSLEMSPYKTSVGWQESALVCFERGWVKLELPAPLVINQPGRVEVFRDPGNGHTPEVTVPQLPPVHAMRQQAINFVKAILGETTPLCDAAEALEDLKVAREYIRLWKGQ